MVGVPFVSLDLSMLSQMKATPISGVLGTDLLAAIPLRLSYSKGTAQIIPDLAHDATPLVLKKVRNRYFLPVRIGPSTFEMLLDSGTNMSALSNFAWRAMPSPWKPNGRLRASSRAEAHPGL